MQTVEGKPRLIQVHPHDNVAIVVNAGGLPAGAVFDSGLVLLEAVPEAHKVALVPIPEEGPVLRYGVVIGYARQSIEPGCWVHEGMMRLPSPPALHQGSFRPATVPAATLPPAHRVFLRGLPQRRRFRRDEKHSRHCHHRAMRRCHGCLCGQQNPVGNTASLSQCR